MKITLKNHLNNEQELKENFLKHRQVTEEWLETINLFYHNGNEMRNFEIACQMIKDNINKKTYIPVDTDTDGFTSTAISYLSLRKRGYNNIEFIIPEGKTHGILLNTIPEDCEFLVVPDSSSSEKEIHKILKERGIDILILDHHEIADEAIENPYAVVVNPHHPQCTYPNKALSAAGVAYKFFQAMDIMEGKDDYLELTDLAALGIIADMMDMSNLENKAIANYGFQNIKNPFISELRNAHSKIKEDNELTSFEISFYVAPVVNAVIRVGTIEDKRAMLEAMVGLQSPQVVIAGLLKVKRSQDSKKEPLLLKIVMDLQKTGYDKNPIILAKSPSMMPKSLTGLIAGQLASMYKRPALLGRIEDGKYIGSLRSLQNSTVEKLKDFCEQSGLFDWVAGHQSAAGFQIPEENIEKFIEYAKENLPAYEEVYMADYSLMGLNKAEIVEFLVNFKPHYCKGFEEPILFDTLFLKPEEFRVIGKNKNTISIKKADMEYIMFNQKNIPEITKPIIMKIIGTAEINEYMGNTTPQILIKNYEIIEDEL